MKSNTSASPRAGSTELPNTLIHALERNAEQSPNHVIAKWVSQKGEVVDSLTYLRLWNQSSFVASLLVTNGVQRGERVMIAYSFGLDFLAGLLGCMRIGAIPCSVYPPNIVDKSKARFSFDQFNKQVTDAGARFALTSTSFKRLVHIFSALTGHKAHIKKWIATNRMKLSNRTQTLPNLDGVTSTDTAFIQYSSGSTGEPKGIVISHGAILHNLRSTHVGFNIESGSVGVTWMPQYHDYALVSFFLMSCVFSDFPIVACSPIDFIRNPTIWIDVIESFGGTHTAGPNFAYGLLAKRMRSTGRKLQQPSFKQASIAAEPISPQTIQEMVEIGFPTNAINPCYGMAEVCAAATSCVGDEVRVIEGVVSSGIISLSDAHEKIVRVASVDGIIFEDGEVGEIFLRGPDLAEGYWNKPDLNHRFRAVLSDGEEYFATGDLGKIVDDRLYVVGRLKELIIVNGRNIYPTDIERVIEHEFADIVRPGSTVAFQRTDSDVGMVLEIRNTVANMESVSETFSLEAVRSLVSQCSGVDVGQLLALRQGTVPKTTSGKLKRVETRRKSSAGEWNPKDCLMSWVKPPQQDRGRHPAESVCEETEDHSHTSILCFIVSMIQEEFSVVMGHLHKIEDYDFSAENIVLIHRLIREKYNLREENFPVTLLTGTKLTEIADEIKLCVNGKETRVVSGEYDELTNDVLSIIALETNKTSVPEDTLGTLSLTSISISSLHAAILEKYNLSDDEFSISLFFESQTTVAELVGAVRRASMATRNNSVTGDSTHESPRLRHDESLKREVFEAPKILPFVSCLIQLVCLLIPPIYLALSVAPLAGLLVLPWSMAFALLLAPIGAILYALGAAVVLVCFKWLILGKLKPGYFAVWGSKFAQRWVVRQCCRMCFRYTPWRFMNGTESMSILQRCLGCELGKGAFVNHECIDDFDLVVIGDRSVVSGFVNPADVSVGVLSLTPITIGSDCSLADDCLVEMGCVVEDEVHVHPRTLVTKGVTLASRSSWHGKPAQESVRPQLDFELGVVVDDSAVDFVERSQHMNVTSSNSPAGTEKSNVKISFAMTQYLTLFVVSPYMSALEFTVAYLTGKAIYDSFGWIGLSALVWIPTTASMLLASLVTVFSKKALLGVVKPGMWPLFGSFHRRKYVVDHLVEAHLLVWNDIATATGSPFAWGVSPVVHHFLWNVLGGEVGRNTVLPGQMPWTGYDLVNIGDFNLWGGGSTCLPWSIEKDYLVARSIRTDNNCYIGTNSTVIGGVTMEDDATVAGCSVATECVGRGQTVIGIDTTTSKLEQSPDRSASVFARSCVALHLAGVLLWLSAAGTGSLTLWVLQDATSSTLDGLSIHARTTWISLIMGVAVGLFFPFYGGIVNLISKTVFVGTYRPGNIEFDSRGLVQYWAAMAISMLKDDSVRVHLGGTFLENLYYAMMGARIGANVFLDSVYFFEPNLVTIGSNTSIGLSTTLAPHQVTRNAVELAQLNVGDRCTTGVNAVLHGRDLLQDDSTLSGKSMGLIGTRMKGAYSGYPARRTGVAFQPKRPSLPAWYILLTHPVSALWGSFWWIILSVRGRLCFRKLSFEKGGSNSRPDYPSHFCGQYNSCDGPPFSIRLDCGCWTSNLRLLVLKAGSYVEADESFRGHALCRFVSYSLSFSDDKLTAAEGRLSFGWWHVPESIVCLRLWREEDDWMAGHSWFMGDPHETVRFRPSRTTLSDA